MQQTVTQLEIQPGTSHKVMDRIPKIIEGIADGRAIQDIATDLGVDRVTIWRNLQRVDFSPVVSLLVTDILEELHLIEDAKDRNWLRTQLLKALHSKKTRGELTITRHDITEERKTARLELDLLTPDEQRLLIQLQDKMKPTKPNQEE
jgi:predicted DNA-binding protein YlxM (UPF0122 family)